MVPSSEFEVRSCFFQFSLLCYSPFLDPIFRFLKSVVFSTHFCCRPHLIQNFYPIGLNTSLYPFVSRSLFFRILFLSPVKKSFFLLPFCLFSPYLGTVGPVLQCKTLLFCRTIIHLEFCFFPQWFTRSISFLTASYGRKSRRF